VTTIGSAGKLDVQTMVAQLVAADRAPADARMDRTGRQLTAQVSAIGTLRSAFSSLRTAVNALSAKDAIEARKVVVPEGANFAATAGIGAATGRYEIEVLQLATAQKLASAAFTSSGATIGTGQLTISAGGSPLTIDIDETNNTLAGIRDAINAKAGGKIVSASIVTGDDGAHLVLNAVNTGTAGALTISASGGDGGLAALTYDPLGSSGMTERMPAADARVKVDGFERTVSGNTLGDVISGVSLTLTRAEPGTRRELRIEADGSAQLTAAKNFVNAYNMSLAAIATTTSYNTSTQVAAALNGDAMTRNAAKELRDAVSSNVTDLKAMGISIAKEGTLKLDEAAFGAGLAKDPAVAARLFATGTASMAGKLDATLDRLVDAEGLLATRSENLAKRTKALDSQRSALDFRMSQAESRYRTQFTALDVLLSSLQTSSDFLSQQLSAFEKPG
jgi:flagellar hook-associated protein 2